MLRWPSRPGLVAAGLVTWLAATAPTGLQLVRGALDPVGAAAWATAALGFAIAFLRAVTVDARRRRVAAMAAQTAAAFALLALGRDAAPAALLVVVAGQLPLALEIRAATAWLVVQAGGLAGLALAAPSPIDPAGAAAYAGFQGFAFAAALLVRREARAREELARTHAELVATQALLAESVRVAERARIARDLHDSLGHHLGALGIHLELARVLAGGAAAEPIARSRELALQLLADVRDAVGALRDDDVIDLAGALTTMAAGIPTPVVHLSIADGAALVDPPLAQVLFRCAQEGLTNAVRHARAARVWIDLAADERGGLALSIRDDGVGATSLVAGAGLAGLRHRVEAAGGRVELDTAPGRGVHVRVSIPDRAARPA